MKLNYDINELTFENYKKYQQEYYQKRINNRKNDPYPWDVRNLEYAKDVNELYDLSTHFALIMYNISDRNQSWFRPTSIRIAKSLGVTYGDAKNLTISNHFITKNDLCLFPLEEKYLTEIGFDFSKDLDL